MIIVKAVPFLLPAGKIIGKLSWLVKQEQLFQKK